MIARPPANKATGFTLIEMLVAMVILSLSLGVLYQAAAGATRNVRVDEQYSYAIQIAQSLLAEYPLLPPGGITRSGVNGDFDWRLHSENISSGSRSSDLDAAEIRLHQLDVVVSWEPGSRQVKLSTVVPIMDEDAGE